MKKIFVTLIFGILVMGAGCSEINGVSKMSTSSNSETPTSSEARPGSKYVNYKYITDNLKKGKITELKKMDRSFAMPHTSIKEQQITKYFKLGNAYFATFKSGGVKEDRELVPLSLERSGVLYALNDDKQWNIFFEVVNKEETDRNNPEYIWSEGSKINILVHDVVGANNGEGVAKIVSSVDAGKTWKIEKCFYLNMSEFNKLNNNLIFIDKLKAYLAKVYTNGVINEEYAYNDQTDQFETVQFNPETKKNEKVRVGACGNIVLP